MCRRFVGKKRSALEDKHRYSFFWVPGGIKNGKGRILVGEIKREEPITQPLEQPVITLEDLQKGGRGSLSGKSY